MYLCLGTNKDTGLKLVLIDIINVRIHCNSISGTNSAYNVQFNTIAFSLTW